ncbi:probable disease resistance protein At5g63020 [Pistacia vera]|uniref:probable disease resistance protein At5g63020 n=1 Tax=Pistacia vera TaxID=55513 RepID=UPI001263D328|nr:probable disease resistance protein At5g63020 [Pistacia vera]
MTELAAAQTAIAGADFAIKQGTGIINSLKRKYGYVKDMTQNYKKLLEEYRKLCLREEDIDIKLKRYEMEVDETEESKDWRGKVKRMIVEVEELKTEYVRHSRSRWFLYLMKLGRRIVKKTVDVVSLTNERVPNIMVRKAPAPHTSIPTNENIEFPSVEENVNKLLEYLRKEDIKTIGVRGPIGVGKSTIMNYLQQKIQVLEDFDTVILIKVGSEGAESYIQQELQKQLNIPEERSDEQKKKMIHDNLKNKKYLLLLDDVFSNIDLKKVGINYEHQGKVVIASRYKEVCWKLNEGIEVKRLSDTDAEDMFWDKVGKDLKKNRHIKTHAELIIKFCSGMPYLINLIGNYLREMTRAENVYRESIWRSTWDLLTSPRGEPKGDLETVYKYLKLETDRLKGNDKSCFLYLASFPSSHELLHDYIIECWRAQQFLKNFPKLGMARDHGCNLLLHFINHFLLEKETEAQYKMFEFYRRLAPSIARDDNNCVHESRILVTELGVDVNPTDGRWNQIVDSVVAEVAALTELTTLCFYFPTVNSFETYIHTSMSWNLNNEWRPERLRSFKIIVGQQQENCLTEFDAFRWSAEKRLRFSAGETFPDAILKILKEASSFELIAHTAENLSVFSAENLEGLEVCAIKDCPEMTSIIDGNGAAFQLLKKLHIDGLLKLEHIWKNSVIPELSLIQLTNLKVKGCHSLRVLFSENMVLRLNQLQQIQVEDCRVIEEITKDGSIVDSGAFPNLKELELINLPLLSNICNNADLTWNSLQLLKIDACVELTNFPFTFKGAEKLKSIYCTENP